jgi:hypothetical protein
MMTIASCFFAEKFVIILLFYLFTVWMFVTHMAVTRDQLSVLLVKKVTLLMRVRRPTVHNVWPVRNYLFVYSFIAVDVQQITF